MHQIRQLAAIMFTDIVGYTALMGEDERKAFSILTKNRELQKPIIEKYGGRWIKEIGDGVMASFHTVSDAVYAAKEIQEQCKDLGEFSLRIGIHQGEVLFQDDDVFGDTVNIASRLQASAPIRGIWISESVYNNISNKNDIRAEFVRTEVLKNVREPVRIYEVKTNNSVDHLFNLPSPQKNSEETIAVLPFADMSKDKDQEYFSDGLSEELLNLLSKTPGLKVIGRTSSFYFKGKNEDLRVIGNKLGASYLLEGSVRRSGVRLRITTQLIKAVDGSHLWSETYDRVEDDIFKIQDEVAASVVNELKLKLSPSLNQWRPTPNLESYNLVLQGNYFFDRLDRENVEKSIELYQKAIALDPTYDKAWAVLARSYSRLAWFNFMDQNEGFEKARAASIKALEINATSVDGLRALGDVKQYHDFDWLGAEADFKKALDLEPGNAEVISIYSVWHQIKGDFETALSLSKQVLSKDPLRPLYYLIEGLILTFSGKYQQAINVNRKILEINPTAHRVYGIIGRNYLFLGQLNDALEAISMETWDFFREFNMNLYYHAANKKNEADELLNNFIKHYQEHWPFHIGLIYSYREEKDKAIEWLEKAFESKDAYMVYLKGEPLLKNLQKEPRYHLLLKKMNLK